MLLYTRKPTPAPPKRRSRTGCKRCKEKKKKCTEERPTCQRCVDDGAKCEYEPIQPRKRRNPGSSSDAAPPGTRLPVIRSRVDRRSKLREEALRKSSMSDLSIVSKSSTIASNPMPHDHEAQRLQLNTAMANMGALSSVSSGPILDSYLVSLAETTPFPAVASPSSVSQLENAYAWLHNVQAPAYVADSPSKSLLDNFCARLAPRLVCRGEGNPFLEQILPLAKDCPPLLSTLLLVSTGYLEQLGQSVQYRSLDLLSHVFRELSNAIGQKKPEHEDSLLAATVLLLYYEAIRSNSSVILMSHLNGALSMINERVGVLSATTVFLEKAIRYFDVLHALASGSAPLTNNVIPFTTQESPQSFAPSSVDHIFGLMTDLWPVLHDLALLVATRRHTAATTHGSSRSAQLSPELMSRSMSIERFLHQWKPDSQGAARQECAGRDDQYRALINHAEAFRLAGLIHLYKEIHGYDSASAQVQAPVRQVLQACSTVLSISAPTVGLVCPLFIAALEAVEEADIETILSLFSRLQQLHGMHNIAVALGICKEVWRRRNSNVEVTDWRPVAEQMDEALVMG